MEPTLIHTCLVNLIQTNYITVHSQSSYYVSLCSLHWYRHQSVWLPEPGSRLHPQFHRRPGDGCIVSGWVNSWHRHHPHNPAARGSTWDWRLRHPYPVWLHQKKGSWIMLPYSSISDLNRCPCLIFLCWRKEKRPTLYTRCSFRPTLHVI